MIDFSHLSKIEESYFVHLAFAVRLAIGFVFLACISIIHGLFPFILTTTVSKQVDVLNKKLKKDEL